MPESDIMYENGAFWVCRDKAAKKYVVYQAGVTHSKADSAYALTEDGYSIAMYRCDYLAKKAKS